MKITRKQVGYFFAAVVVLYLLNYRLTVSPNKSTSTQWTVYGSNKCGWTRKQLDYMKSNTISHKFVDCDKENCGDVTAFPTMKGSNGELVVGFSNSL